MQARETQPERFIEAAHEVHALHGGPSGTPHQVVNRAEDDHAIRTRVRLEADVAPVRSCQDLWLWVAVDPSEVPDQSHERLVVLSSGRSSTATSSQASEGGKTSHAENPAHQFDARDREMHVKRAELSHQFLLDFGLVSMAHGGSRTVPRRSG